MTNHWPRVQAMCICGDTRCDTTGVIKPNDHPQCNGFLDTEDGGGIACLRRAGHDGPHQGFWVMWGGPADELAKYVAARLETPPVTKAPTGPRAKVCECGHEQRVHYLKLEGRRSCAHVDCPCEVYVPSDVEAGGRRVLDEILSSIPPPPPDNDEPAFSANLRLPPRRPNPEGLDLATLRRLAADHSAGRITTDEWIDQVNEVLNSDA